MASSIPLVSPKDFPLELQLEWYKIRDLFFGWNFVRQNIPTALELASSCVYPDACWLTKVCAGKNVKTEKDVKRVFSVLDKNDARGLFYMWALSYNINLEPLERSAKLGFAPAQASLARHSTEKNHLKFAQQSAEQGERDGFYRIGICFRDGEGCEKDLNKAKENFLKASKLGHGGAMLEIGRLLNEFDPQRWKWWGRTAALGNVWKFLACFEKEVKLFNDGKGHANIMFAIGQALQEHVDNDRSKIFNIGLHEEKQMLRAKQAVSFYQSQLKASRRAVDEWTKIALRFRVCKDIRILIGRMIWSARKEALYAIK